MYRIDGNDFQAHENFENYSPDKSQKQYVKVDIVSEISAKSLQPEMVHYEADGSPKDEDSYERDYPEKQLQDEPDLFDDNEKDFGSFGEEDDERQQILKQKYDEYFSSDGGIDENLDAQDSESSESEQELSPQRFAKMTEILRAQELAKLSQHEST